ncbi:hypothetical protein ACFXA3_36375, partial [Streptomyces sp. NPDC059456]|uniref:hypothetical protein n=1 Tax=Streptomyces sp. NPDC059456 TaxID=3346838 RepID=UPI0036A3AB94
STPVIEPGPLSRRESAVGWFAGRIRADLDAAGRGATRPEAAPRDTALRDRAGLDAPRDPAGLDTAGL